jgi:hypothetical protein
MLKTADRAIAGTELQLVTPLALWVWGYYLVETYSIRRQKSIIFYRHLGCWTRDVMLQAQAQALEPPA